MRKKRTFIVIFFWCYPMFVHRTQSAYTSSISWNYHMNGFAFILVRCTKIVEFFLFLTFIANWNRTPQSIARQPAQKCCSKRITRNLAHLQAHEVSEASECWTCSNAPTKIPAGNLCVSQQQKLSFLSIETKRWINFWHFEFYCDFFSLSPIFKMQIMNSEHNQNVLTNDSDGIGVQKLAESKNGSKEAYG